MRVNHTKERLAAGERVFGCQLQAYRSPEIARTFAAIESCRRHGVVPGIQTRSVAMAKMWAERGMRFVGAAAEHALLLQKAREAVTILRAPRQATSAP